MDSLSTRLPRLRGLLHGDTGPADVVVTRTADAVHFRLPTRRCGWVAYALILAASSLVAVDLAWQFDALALAAIPFMAYVAWRFVWHYEIILNEKHLRVDCFSSWRRGTYYVIALSHVGQLTVVQGARLAWLQAESSNDEAEPILDDWSADLLERLARQLTECHAELTKRRPPIRVAREAPLAQVRTERLQPPLNSRIVINQQSGGIVVDFPAPPMVVDPEPTAAVYRRILVPCILIGTVMSVSVAGLMAAMASKRADEVPAVAFATLLIGFPIFTLLAAIVIRLRDEIHKPSRQRAECWPRRLIMTDRILIRTLLAGGKNVWYRDEVERIEVEIVKSHSGARTLWLRLVTKVGEHADLLGGIEDRGVADYRRRAELEWVATELQRTLNVPPLPADAITAGLPRTWRSEHVQDRGGYRGVD